MLSGAGRPAWTGVDESAFRSGAPDELNDRPVRSLDRRPVDLSRCET